MSRLTRRQARFTGCLMAFLFLCTSVVPAAGDERVSRVHPLGMADQQATYGLVKELLSGEGRAVLDEGHNSLIVLDDPAVQERVAALLSKMQGPLPSVRVEVRIVDGVTGEAASVSTTGQLLLPFREGPGGAVQFETGSRKSGASRSASQQVLVVSGGSAAIFVGREIPYQKWFYSYGRRFGFITSEIQWREVGSRLNVTPVVTDGGRKVRLRVTPEFEYAAGGGKRKKRRSVVSYAGAVTELVVDSGEEVRMAVSGDTEEFYERFFTGYDRQRRTRRVEIYLTATVVPYNR